MLARKIAAYGFMLLSTSFLFGSIVLDFFGITLAVVQICGGVVLAVTGWSLLTQKEQDSPSDQSSESLEDALDHAFFPLTLPITVGPGCISIAITLGAHLRHEAGPGFEHGYPRHFIAALAGMFIVCVLVMICYTYADRLTRLLGRSGTGILIRLSAFILLAIGVQIMSNGIRSEFPGLLGPIHNQVSRLSSEGQSRNHVVVCAVRASVSRSVSLRQVANVGIPEEVNHG
jgi:multiple antibiotic resistance protein